MAYAIDPRLLNCDGEMEIGTNFNRVLKLLDAMACKEEDAGDYTLSATVDSDGDVTYTWTAVEGS